MLCLIKPMKPIFMHEIFLFSFSTSFSFSFVSSCGWTFCSFCKLLWNQPIACQLQNVTNDTWCSWVRIVMTDCIASAFLCNSLDMQANLDRASMAIVPLPLPNGLILTVWLTDYCRTPHPQLRWSDTRPTSANWSAPSWRQGTARKAQPNGRRGCRRLPCARPDLMRHQW